MALLWIEKLFLTTSSLKVVDRELIIIVKNKLSFFRIEKSSWFLVMNKLKIEANGKSCIWRYVTQMGAYSDLVSTMLRWLLV